MGFPQPVWVRSSKGNVSELFISCPCSWFLFFCISSTNDVWEYSTKGKCLGAFSRLVVNFIVCYVWHNILDWFMSRNMSSDLWAMTLHVERAPMDVTYIFFECLFSCFTYGRYIGHSLSFDHDRRAYIGSYRPTWIHAFSYNRIAHQRAWSSWSNCLWDCVDYVLFAILVIMRAGDSDV